MVAVRLVGGLVLFGAGVAFLIESDLGTGPWDVLHVGLADATGLSVGTIIVLLGAVLLAVQFVMREPIGIGTLVNVAVIGPAADAVIWLVPDTELLAPRLALMLAGPVLVAVGSGYYLGVHLGVGPRDGLMTAVARRTPLALRSARFSVEATALVVGWALGGPVGVGTIWFAISIGPLVHWCYDRLALPTDEPLHGT